jgi:hypothetical protein
MVFDDITSSCLHLGNFVANFCIFNAMPAGNSHCSTIIGITFCANHIDERSPCVVASRMTIDVKYTTSRIISRNQAIAADSLVYISGNEL